MGKPLKAPEWMSQPQQEAWLKGTSGALEANTITPIDSAPKAPLEPCPLCGDPVGVAKDVHIVLVHPETLPKPEMLAPKKKGRGKKK